MHQGATLRSMGYGDDQNPLFFIADLFMILALVFSERTDLETPVLQRAGHVTRLDVLI